MRTLHRPMFNMGGPIKEGIMHGIREPYAGGQLVRPGPGRPGYAGEETFWNKLISQYNPKNFASPKKFIQRINPFGKRIKTVQKVAPTAWSFLKNRTKGWLPTAPKKVVGKHGWLEGSAPVKNQWGILTTPGKQTVKLGDDIMGKVPFKGNKLNYIKQFAKENPGWATMGGGAALTVPNLAYKTVPPIVKGVGSIGKTYIDAILLGDQSDWFTKEKIADNLKPIVSGGGDGLSTEDTSTAESRAAFANKQRSERVNKYLDLMGYERSKKTAIGDALIDASKIVSDRGSLDLKNITRELINPIIQSTSKRLDKPEQIREAVGLMMTKAGLEKEMYDAKPGTQLKAAQDYVSQFGGTMNNAYKQLGLTKKGNFTESLGALAKQYDKSSDSQKVIIENIKFQKANEPGFDIDSIKVLEDNDFLKKAQEQEDFVSITDTVLRHPEAHKEVDGQIIPIPGVYLIGSAVVEVSENGNVKRLN